MRRLDGLGQLEEALAGRSEVFCANQVEIFAVLATAAGVPTRIVDVAGRLRDLDLGAHAFNECYLADRGQWAYVDLQLDLALPESADGRALNGIDLLMRAIGSGGEGATILRLAGGSAERVALSEVGERLDAFLPPSATLVYLWSAADRFSPWRRLERLFLRPQPSFSLSESDSGALRALLGLHLGLGAAGLSFFLLLRRARSRSAGRKGSPARA
jgi:hypothetical protein